MGKILLADDHPHIVRLLQMSLQADGHTILSTTNGLDALEVARAEHPDLVILDVNMPGLDGFRVLSRIKSDPELRDIVVVMLTIQDHAEEVTLGLEIGADYYLGKPFRPDEIRQLVRRIFEIRTDC
jgi:DNA-binding response OmpR family regulator